MRRDRNYIELEGSIMLPPSLQGDLAVIRLINICSKVNERGEKQEHSYFFTALLPSHYFSAINRAKINSIVLVKGKIGFNDYGPVVYCTSFSMVKLRPEHHITCKIGRSYAKSL